MTRSVLVDDVAIDAGHGWQSGHLGAIELTAPRPRRIATERVQWRGYSHVLGALRVSRVTRARCRPGTAFASLEHT